MKKNIYYGYYKCDDNISRIKKIKEAGLDGVFVFLEDGVLELINDLNTPNKKWNNYKYN